MDREDRQPLRPTAEELEEVVLGAVPRYTRTEVAEQAGITAQQARRVWRALGFANTGDAPVFTDNDVSAVRTVFGLVRTGVIDEDQAVQLVRAFGRAMSRLADWQIEVFAQIVDDFESEESAGYGSRMRAAYELAREAVPVFEELLVYSWHRHLARALDRVILSGQSDGNVLSGTFSVGFADLVSYTRLSRGLDERQLISLVDEFETRTADIVAGADARLVKTLGDEVLFVAPTPLVAVDIAMRMIEEIGLDPTLPDVRIGVATGLVLTRRGDVFGTTVNLASRITALAQRNGLLVDSYTAEALLAYGGFDLRTQPPRPVRGVGDVVTVEVRAAPGVSSL